MNRLPLAVVALSLFLLAPPAFALGDAELEEDCATRAAREWAMLHPGSKNSETTMFDAFPRTVTYAHHYSGRLNTCLYIETIDWNNSSTIAVTELTTDEHVHIPRGMFQAVSGKAPGACEVYPDLNTSPPLVRCRSKAEWQELMKPYLQD